MIGRARAALVAGAVLLAGCHLDVTVELTLGADGTGELTVTAVADADVVTQAPGLARDLRLDDASAAGWVVEGPAATDDGGLTVTLRHPVTSPRDATNLLASLGPPFVNVTLSRTTDGDTTTVELGGTLTLSGGFDAFADADLLAAVGGTPFADDLAAAGATPQESVSVTFRADLPGDIEATTGDTGGGAVEWVAPLDGSSLDLATRGVQRPSDGAWWAGPLATLALVALIAWVVASGVLITYVLRARQARQRSRRPT